MPKIKYVEKRFREKSLLLIMEANKIINDLKGQGYDITLRQLYYQFVSKNLIPNNQKEYDNLGNLINDARLAGLVDWDSLVDRTRQLRGLSHWTEPAEIINDCAGWYNLDKWEGQEHRVEVWVEKDALVGVIGQMANKLDVPYFSCRGYTSQTEMWGAAQRLIRWRRKGYTPVIIHLGDHDPSGIDMTRDIGDRLRMFCGEEIEVRRIALNKDQIRKYNPPPNPAKLSDCRATKYIEEHGASSWELDALDPKVISALIKKHVESLRDEDAFDAREELEEEHRAKLREIAEEHSE